jgi:hypothetical protein
MTRTNNFYGENKDNDAFFVLEQYTELYFNSASWWQKQQSVCTMLQHIDTFLPTFEYEGVIKKNIWKAKQKNKTKTKTQIISKKKTTTTNKQTNKQTNKKQKKTTKKPPAK